MKLKFEARLGLALSLMVAAIVSRLLPHPFNFTPIVGVALFGGRHIQNRLLGFGVPLFSMLVSDFFLGFHALIPVTYACFLAITWAARRYKHKEGVVAVGSLCVSASVFFFVITNLAVWFYSSHFSTWLTGLTYSKSLAGLSACFAAAIPYFGRSLAGDLFYTGLLFGSFAALKSRLPLGSKQRISLN